MIHNLEINPPSEATIPEPNLFKTYAGTYYRDHIQFKDDNFNFGNNLTDPIHDDINELLKKNCTEDELLEYIGSIKLDPSNPYKYKNLYKHIVTNLLESVIDTIIIQNENYLAPIQLAICQHTDNIDLCKKYCQNSYFDSFNAFCASLCYKNKPSVLSEYIFENYEMILATTSKYFFLNFGSMHKDTQLELIVYVIDKFNISYSKNNYYEFIFNTLGEDSAIIILNKLLNNVMYDINLIIPDLIEIIIEHCSVSNVKFFVEKYITNIQILIKLLSRTNNFDTFKYLVEVINNNALIDPKLFYLTNYEIVEWLLLNNIMIKPNITYCSNYKIILLVVKAAVLNNDVEYLKENTSNIMIKMYENYDKLFDIVPMNIFDLDKMFEHMIIFENYKLIDEIIGIGFKPKNISDIMHDLKLLKKDQMLEYIANNF